MESTSNQSMAFKPADTTVQIVDRPDEAKNNLSRKKFTSKWEYTKFVSQWHFDPSRNDQGIYKVFMHLDGDWKKEVEKLDFEIQVGLVNYGFKGKDHDDIIANDFIEWGYPQDLIQYDRSYKVPPSLMKLAEQLKLKHPDVRIHRQRPGMVGPIHIDTFCSHPAMDKDPSLDANLMRRFVIQLTDWDWGHFWSFGNESWQQWKAGDVVYFDSRDVVHATANAGKSSRITMIVTGWMTDETIALINGKPKSLTL